MQVNERVLITGATAGIGRALALAYATRRAHLVLVARNRAALAELTADVEAREAKAVVVVGDVALAETADAAVATALESFGGIDCLIMNAGRGGPMFVDAFDAREGVAVMTVNYFGMLYMLERVLPIMRSQRTGVIVGIGSLAGIRGMPGSGAYNASKAAVAILLESIRTELRGTGVDVVTILPGFVRTNMTAKNEFHMPFLMESSEAAKRIMHAVDRRASVYRFPWPTSIAMHILQCLPNALYDRLIRWGRARGARMHGR